MARFEAFRGTTYDPGKVVADDVIAPPYDVVSPTDRAALAARSPYNAIEIELPVRYPEAGLDPYENAAAMFDHWHREGIVGVEEEAGFYVYRMTYRIEDGSTRRTTGVLGALGLDPEHRGDVLPHEETTPKDKSDRLSLLRATGANVSPIWGLAVGSGLSAACEAAIATAAPPWTATDSDGVVHERWTVTDPDVVGAISSVVAAAPVLIADGHHRYETACTFFTEQPGDIGADLILALVVELGEDELAVQGIHRLLDGVDAAMLPALFGRHFEVEPGPSEPLELVDTMASAGALGLITPDGSWLMHPRAELLAHVDDDLDSSRLAFVLDDLGIKDVHYQHGALLAQHAVESEEADAAVLLRPVSISQIARTARGGRRMPPKSTFFHPKPRTGMVFRELDPNRRTRQPHR
ncbi:MAG: DUF1015 domain-containing protein [Acidimicrobiales bacterium]|jgi:uncharacterized protein (DUF1015 family)